MAQNFTNTLPKPSTPMLAPSKTGIVASPSVLTSALQSKANPLQFGGGGLNLNQFNQAQSSGLVSSPKTVYQPAKVPGAPTPVGSPTSYGSYKGIAITPGDNTAIQSQMAAIDARNAPQAPVAQPAPVTSPTPTPTQNPVGYGGLIQQLASRAQPSQQYTDLSNQAAEQYKVAGDTNQLIQRSQSDALHNPNFSLDTGIGRAGQIQQNYGQIGANALTQAQGLANLASAANTQQGLQQTALGTAAGLAAPQQVSYSNQYIDPTTGLPVNPQAGQDMQNAVALQVQKLQSGATDPASARAALSAYGQAGTNALEQALGSGFNPNIASTNQQSASDLTNQANQLQSTFNGVDANFRLLLNTATQGGVNDSNVPALNAIQQNVARGLASNEAVINFKNTLAAVRSGYANILGGGTTTVDSQNRAQEAIPDNISVGALKSLGEQLKSEATNRIAGINQQVKSLTNSGSSSSSGNIFDF